MSDPIIIRPSTAADADELREIRLLALRSEPDAYGSTYEESQHYRTARWKEMAADWNYFLALANGQPVAMASGGIFAPFPSARWLYGMFVHVDHRGTGLADEMVATVADWARRQDVLTLGLHVTTTVLRAKAFYERLGFVAVGSPEPMERDATLRLQTMTTDLRTNARI